MISFLSSFAVGGAGMEPDRFARHGQEFLFQIGNRSRVGGETVSVAEGQGRIQAFGLGRGKPAQNLNSVDA